MWEEVDDEALADLFISTLTSSECTRFLDKFQQYRHNVCRAPATEIAPSPLLGEGREAPGEPNSSLDARNFFEDAKGPFQRNQFGGYLGGWFALKLLF